MVAKESYRNIDSEIRRNLIREDRLSIPPRGKWADDARRYANQLKYSDDQIIRVAQNRVRFHAAEKNSLFARFSVWLHQAFGRTAPAESFRVAGHELRVLLAIAELDGDPRIQDAHEYEVEPHYYEKLVDLAASKCGAV
ncbi:MULTISPECIES: hypothetical protein [Marinobacter]|uniref:hypothetical protein n=1 Tax=Marinobacter TaxID=2742 RepID=UPI001BD06B42|nr:hypothetical protein [Marinobacter salarius]MBS8233287.1 hypothetical protein [Marinobacter salarius]WOI18376.1 hypothetical protein R1T46_16560 [Marinobacter salarius]